MIAPNQFSLLAICPSRFCSLQSPFARIRPVTPHFCLLLPCPSDSSGFEHSKLIRRCSRFFKCVSRSRGGS